MKTFKLSTHDWLVRLDAGEEIMTSLAEFAHAGGITAASFTGIGAVGELKYGYFDISKKQYAVAEEKISLEIVSLVGNIARMDDEPIVHAHISVGFPDMSVRGGHLVQGVISVTAEIFVRTYKAEVKRAKDKFSGLNLIR